MSTDAHQLPDHLVELESPVEWQRFCPRCDHSTRHVSTHATDDGLVAICATCSRIALAPWTRACTLVGRRHPTDLDARTLA